MMKKGSFASNRPPINASIAGEGQHPFWKLSIPTGGSVRLRKCQSYIDVSGSRRPPTLTNRRKPRCTSNMVKPLSFKGDKKQMKRKRPEADKETEDGPSTQLRKLDDDAQADNDDSWVSAETLADVVGPVMIVLPTEKASALACDPSGKVFALPIENIVDGNPGSAEPHDVRQVWVAHKLAGTESYRLKGHHGR